LPDHRTPRRTAIIIGAGPAGLTAAYELIRRTDIEPIVFERSHYMGGIARTVEHHGNRIDIGGHRFFSKSERVMNWWLEILPLQKLSDPRQMITYRQRTTNVAGSATAPDPDHEDRVMLVRSRRSRIYFDRKFFDYPITLSSDTLRKFGIARSLKIAFSYLKSVLFPIRPEKNLEDFFINRFGRELYATFFKSYTEKVWGLPCHEISAEWGAQRVKGLSIAKAIAHFLKTLTRKSKGIAQKSTETSLIEQFLYPKYGPGQMWEEVARRLRDSGARILTGHKVNRILTNGDGSIRGVRVTDESGVEREYFGEYFFSSMPVSRLIGAFDRPVPTEVSEVANGLQYRDFITVGLLYNQLKISDPDGGPVRDNWIYIQEPDVLVGRLQIFNNWSPYMVADRSKAWIGLEYFCNATDPIWKWPDQKIIDLAVAEMDRIGIAGAADALDALVIRMPKTYPAYFGTYDRFDVIRKFVDDIPNLFLVGRNGMHRYNNQDHSMLTAMVAVDNIMEGRMDKANLWEVNTEEAYHEEA
jgi:protoporphyrinogen oxidase